jgi:hypothetical protein
MTPYSPLVWFKLCALSERNPYVAFFLACTQITITVRANPVAVELPSYVSERHAQPGLGVNYIIVDAL